MSRHASGSHFWFHGVSVICVMLAASGAAASQVCFDRASERHGIAPELLRAIAQQESAMNPVAVNHNRDGSMDIGLMQINSRWVSTLARYGIERHMLWDPCTNVDVGAWILAANFRRYGVNWNGLGAYNAGSAHLRIRYARQIVSRLRVAKPAASPLAEPAARPSEVWQSAAPRSKEPSACESPTDTENIEC